MTRTTRMKKAMWTTRTLKLLRTETSDTKAPQRPREQRNPLAGG
jgi:hypothetical protein